MVEHHESLQQALAVAAAAHVRDTDLDSKSDSPQKPSGIDPTEYVEVKIEVTMSDDERATEEPPSKRPKTSGPVPGGVKRPSVDVAEAPPEKRQHIDDLVLAAFADPATQDGFQVPIVASDDGAPTTIADDDDDEKYGPLGGTSGTYDYAFDRLAHYNNAIAIIKDPALFNELTTEKASRSKIKRHYCNNSIHDKNIYMKGFLRATSVSALVTHFMGHAVWQQRACIICGMPFVVTADILQSIARHMASRPLAHLICYRLIANPNLPNECIECEFYDSRPLRKL